MVRSTRRAILRDGVLSVGSTLTGASLFGRLAALGSPANGKTLVVIQMAGGNDGLHAVSPYMDPVYKQSRPTLALTAAQVIPISPALGLHGQFGALKPMWDAKQMAIVENVGYPNPNLSHFQSMYIWQTLDLTGAQGTARTGWLGNYVSTLGAPTSVPFAGLDSGTTQLAPAFMAPNIAVPAISNPQTFGITGDAADPTHSTKRTNDLLASYQNFNGQGTLGTFLGTTAQAATTASADLAKAAAAYKPAVTYPKTPLAASLQLIATAIVQGLDLRVGYATIGGFDTHANEAKTLDMLYQELAEAVTAFYGDLTKHGVADNVLTMTWSEFGRRVKENGSQGTDHGTASPLFVFGPAINGGLIGDPPDLANLDKSGNLVFKIDFRSVYATVLDKWLGADADKLLGGTFDRLAFL